MPRPPQAAARGSVPRAALVATGRGHDRPPPDGGTWEPFPPPGSSRPGYAGAAGAAVLLQQAAGSPSAQALASARGSVLSPPAAASVTRRVRLLWKPPRVAAPRAVRRAAPTASAVLLAVGVRAVVAGALGGAEVAGIPAAPCPTQLGQKNKKPQLRERL